MIGHSHAEILQERATQTFVLCLPRDDNTVEMNDVLALDFIALTADKTIVRVDHDKELVVFGDGLRVALPKEQPV